MTFRVADKPLRLKWLRGHAQTCTFIVQGQIKELGHVGWGLTKRTHPHEQNVCQDVTKKRSHIPFKEPRTVKEILRSL